MTDDGVSGLRFDDRPGYVQMMDEVEDGNVSAICVKDITRLGRDYLRVGMCMEQLRINGVRLIALGDGIDTAKGEDDSKGKIESTQKVEIHLNFIGEYLPPSMESEPTPEENAIGEEELRLTLERREKYRQNYLKRKASGKQQEYDRRYREKHNARIAANKAALFEDGAVLGATALAPVPVAAAR